MRERLRDSAHQHEAAKNSCTECASSRKRFVFHTSRNSSENRSDANQSKVTGLLPKSHRLPRRRIELLHVIHEVEPHPLGRTRIERRKQARLPPSSARFPNAGIRLHAPAAPCAPRPRQTCDPPPRSTCLIQSANRFTASSCRFATSALMSARSFSAE